MSYAANIINISIRAQYHIVVLMIIIRQGFLLSEILFTFSLEKYIFCDACGLRPPSFESSSVLYIPSTCTSSMQESIKQGMEQKLEKSCFGCKKNTWHVKSKYI